MLAQLHMQRGEWEAARAAAERGLALLYTWATQWDKRFGRR